MAKYRVYWETIETHEAIIEADNEDEAWDETGALEAKDVDTSSDFINESLSITLLTEAEIAAFNSGLK